MTQTPPPECTRLALELRALRGRAGLALSALAADSPYSKSSWQRYLSGRSLPPWPAVQLLCRAANEPDARARALWELAEAAWSRRTTTHPQAPATTPESPAHSSLPQPAQPDPADQPDGSAADPPVDSPDPTLTRRRRARQRPRTAAAALVVAVVVGLFGCVALVLTLAAVHNRGRAPAPGHTVRSAAVSTGFHVACTGTACTGDDPQTTGCGVEPQTLLHTQQPGGFGLEIRYNPQCRAAWARVWNAHPADRLTLTTAGQPTQHVEVTHPGDIDPFVYTPLIATTTPGPALTACLTTPSGAKLGCYTAPRP
ncbi:XRE family transcriptional regulator [Streptacidiphilus sp. N1-12]|uniref:XRE family transcriptional regulator n=2 Tax=Streptacidiphilus alkalitolerans TaxID=3342712 RepID=A0ABV6XE64_9ACTN